ncbi:MAG: procyclic acidic repetitive family protein [bacterium]|nr:procyclic acidic repetitive family protein [bacterium]
MSAKMGAGVGRWRVAGLGGELAQEFRRCAESRAREAGERRAAEVVANDVGCGLLLAAAGDERGKSDLANSVGAEWLGCDPRTFQRYKQRGDVWAGAIKRILRGNPKERLSTVCQVRVKMPHDRLGPPRGLLFDARRFYGQPKAVWAAVELYENPGMRGPKLAEVMGLDRGTGRRLWRRLKAVVEQWRATIEGIGPGPRIEADRKRRAGRKAKAEPEAQPKAKPPPQAEPEAQPKAKPPPQAEPEAQRGPPGEVADAIRSAREQLERVRHLR